MAVHDFIYGGMENISATTLVDNRFPDEQVRGGLCGEVLAAGQEPHRARRARAGPLVVRRPGDDKGLVARVAQRGLRHLHGGGLSREEVREVTSSGRTCGSRRSHTSRRTRQYRRSIVEDDYLYPDDLSIRYEYEKGWRG